MSQNTNNSDNQDIDLSLVSKKIGNFFDGVASSVFNCILFFKRNLLWFCVLTVIGVGIGVYLDGAVKKYENSIIVTPNFGSTDYLYSKVDLLESKIKENDTVFMKSIGIENPKNISHIEIQPIIDVYNFVNYSSTNANATQNTQNFELVKLLSEDGDINKVIKDKTTSKNYYRHNIVIITKGLVSEENLIKPLLDFLNQNEYFEVLQNITSENLLINMKQNQEMILQINKLLNKFSSESDPNGSKLVVNTDSSQLNDILKTKQTLVLELGTQREQLINLNSVIKKNSSIINITKSDTINGNLKFVLPFFLIFGFIFINLFSKFYKKQSLKALQNN